MNQILYIKAYQEDGNWRVNPDPGRISLDSPATPSKLPADGLQRWGEQLEQNNLFEYYFSSYVKPAKMPSIVVMTVEHPTLEWLSARFLFRNRTKYRKLRLFRFVFRLLKSESIECIPFACEGCPVGVSPVNGWFRLSITNIVGAARTNYLSNQGDFDNASW